jgi:hypothetical protein
MVTRKSGIMIAAVAALSCLLSVVYVSSCKKAGPPYPNCEGIICENGGYCHVDSIDKKPTPHCTCPVGYEGPLCATESVAKYINTWDLYQVITYSDSTPAIGKDSSYIVFVKRSSTHTTFFINNFLGDNNYNDVICTIDSTNSAHFYFDTLSAFHMVFDHFRLLSGEGTITDSTITATLAYKHLNYNMNWQRDTVSIIMTPHHL